MSIQIKLRRDTYANWTSVNPVLAEGEIGLVTNFADNNTRIKIGDGVTAWEDLDYFTTSQDLSNYVTDAELASALSNYVPTSRTVNGKALSSNISIDKTDVGLGSVDNTSDANKPISTATQTALDLKQDKVIVVSSNQTAVNDAVYHNVATATYTDPSPVEGKGFTVFVRNGTATVGGTAYATGKKIIRTYHSGSWLNDVFTIDSVGAIAPVNTVITNNITVNELGNRTQGQLDNISKLIKHLTNTKLTKSGRYSNRRVGSFARVNYSNQESNGSDTSQTSRLKFYAGYFLNEISIIYNNDWSHNSINTTGDSITIEASLEYPAGTFKRITFAGSSSVTIPYGTQVESDPIGVTIPNNTYYWIRTYISVTAGQKWINTHASDSGYAEGVVLNTNSVVSGTIPNSTTYCFGPSVIFGNHNNNRYSFFCTGDSIALGLGDSGVTSMGFLLGGGLFSRTLGPTSATIYTQLPGGTVAGFITNRGRRLLDLASACDFHLSNYGTNDISGGATFATVAQNLCNLWFLVLSKGIKSYHSTILPRTNISNVPIAAEPVRLQVNTWLRDGAPIDIATQTYAVVGSSGSSIVRVGDLLHPVIYIFELAYLAEVSPNSGTWKPGYTADGVHPNSTGYIAINVGYTDISFLDKF